MSKIFGEKKRVQPLSVTDESFSDEVLKSSLPVMLDIWGPGCGHCKRLEPVILDLAAKYDGRVKVAEMNAAASPGTAAALGVRGTPTVIYFREGKEVERVTGFRGQLYHEEIIETELLSPDPKSD